MAEFKFTIVCDNCENTIVKHNSTGSVLSLKEKLAGGLYTGISSNEQKLYIDDQELENDKNLDDYPIKNNGTLRLVGKRKYWPEYCIFVKTNSGKTFCVYSERFETIGDILHYLQNKENSSVHPVDDYNIFIHGCTLSLDKSLEHYKIGDHSTIYHRISARAWFQNQ